MSQVAHMQTPTAACKERLSYLEYLVSEKAARLFHRTDDWREHVPQVCTLSFSVSLSHTLLYAPTRTHSLSHTNTRSLSLLHRTDDWCKHVPQVCNLSFSVYPSRTHLYTPTHAHTLSLTTLLLSLSCIAPMIGAHTCPRFALSMYLYHAYTQSSTPQVCTLSFSVLFSCTQLHTLTHAHFLSHTPSVSLCLSPCRGLPQTQDTGLHFFSSVSRSHTYLHTLTHTRAASHTHSLFPAYRERDMDGGREKERDKESEGEGVRERERERERERARARHDSCSIQGCVCVCV